MNIALQPPDTRDQLRDFIAEQLTYHATHVACARMFLDINDDAGLAYSLNAGKVHYRAALEAEVTLRRQSRTLAAEAKSDG